MGSVLSQLFKPSPLPARTVAEVEEMKTLLTVQNFLATPGNIGIVSQLFFLLN